MYGVYYIYWAWVPFFPDTLGILKWNTILWCACTSWLRVCECVCVCNAYMGVCVCLCVYYRSIVVNLLYTIAACGEQRRRRRWRFTRAPFVWVSCWIQIWLVFGSTDARKTLVKIIPGILCHSVPPIPIPK